MVFTEEVSLDSMTKTGDTQIPVNKFHVKRKVLPLFNAHFCQDGCWYVRIVDPFVIHKVPENLLHVFNFKKKAFQQFYLFSPLVTADFRNFLHKFSDIKRKLHS